MYTFTMEEMARGALAGLALGSFFAVMVEANRFALKTLWRFNRLAAETIMEISQWLEFNQRERMRRRLPSYDGSES